MSLKHSLGCEARRYFSEKQAASYLGISHKTLQRHRCTGTGPEYIKAGPGRGGRVLYDLLDLDGWMAAMKVRSTSTYGPA